MSIDLSSLSASNVYHLMTQTIVPRPIAWVLSLNTNDSYNLAPFSYFNAVCSNPPLLMVSMGKKPDGTTKDTATNLELGKHCIVHIAHAGQSEMVTATAATLDYGQSEVTLNDISLVEHESWPLKRIDDCPIAYLCKVHSVQEIGEAPQRLVFLEALELYVDEKAIRSDNDRTYIDALSLNPLARLGANQYADLGNIFNKQRPK